MSKPKKKTAMELAIELAEETANHLYDRQDYDRIRDMARGVLKAAGTEAKTATAAQAALAVRREDLPKELVTTMIDAEFNPMSWADGHTFNALRAQYGQDMIVAVNRLVIEPMKVERQAAESTIAAITRKYTPA
jgi:hypothetical protein